MMRQIRLGSSRKCYYLILKFCSVNRRKLRVTSLISILENSLPCVNIRAVIKIIIIYHPEVSDKVVITYSFIGVWAVVNRCENKDTLLSIWYISSATAPINIQFAISKVIDMGVVHCVGITVIK